MAIKKKAEEEGVEDFGEWDTSVTDPPRGARPQDEDEDGPTTTTTTTPAPVVYDEKDFDLMDNPPTDDGTPEEPKAAEVRVPAVKKSTPPPPVQKPPAHEAGFALDTTQSYTIIGPSIVIRGKLKCDENLLVSGRLEADVKSTKDLRIEMQGIMNANIDVHAVSISGIVVGDIRASELVELGSEARVIGDIVTPRLIIHEGAKFRGHIEMEGLQALELVRPQTKVVPTPRASPSMDAPRPARVAVAEVMSDTPNPAAARGETAARSTVSPLEPMALKPQTRPAAVPSRPAAPGPLPVTPSARVAPATPSPAKPVEKPAEPTTEKGGGWFGRRS